MPPVIEETDGDVLAQQAYAELEAVKSGKPLPEEKKPAEKEEKPVEQPSSESPEPSKEAEEHKEEQPKEEPTEAKTEEVEAKVEEKKEEPKAEQEKSEDEVVQEHAIKHGLTYAEAREDIEKTKAIVEKYKNDPFEMARALRSTQSAYDKVKHQEVKKDQIFRRMDDNQFLSQSRAHFEQNKDKFVGQYRDRFPAKSELMTDDAIIDDLVERSLNDYREYADKQEIELRNKASQRRDQLLSSIKESDRRFLPDVKAVIEKSSDHQILGDFDINNVVYWAKGQRYDADIKAAEDRGFKRGQEQTKIIGAKTGGDGTNPPKKPVETFGTKLTKAQKDRAVEMYPAEDGYSAEKAYQMFMETFKDKLKENPSYV